jgi:hypothetical protein
LSSSLLLPAFKPPGFPASSFSMSFQSAIRNPKSAIRSIRNQTNPNSKF